MAVEETKRIDPTFDRRVPRRVVKFVRRRKVDDNGRIHWMHKKRFHWSPMLKAREVFFEKLDEMVHEVRDDEEVAPSSKRRKRQ